MLSFHESWEPLFNQFEFNDIDALYEDKEPVYPKKEDLFKVFQLPVKDIKVVLLGQDPYHGPGQAHGLSFSVPNGVTIPPSLRNIYKELQDEFPERSYKFTSGNLERWLYEEKIFLLNASLSVIKGNQVVKWIFGRSLLIALFSLLVNKTINVYSYYWVILLRQKKCLLSVKIRLLKVFIPHQWRHNMDSLGLIFLNKLNKH